MNEKDARYHVGRVSQHLQDKIYNISRHHGWGKNTSREMAKVAQVPFFQLLNNGATPWDAMITSFFFVDRLSSGRLLDAEMNKGQTAEQAFDVLLNLRMKFYFCEYGMKIHDKMRNTFLKALEETKVPQKALNVAFTEARKVVKERILNLLRDNKTGAA